MNIKNFMAQDHRDCDLLFASAENAVAKNDWEAATQAFDGFFNAMERHLGVEEDDLFPAFEKATGIVTGPTEMMRMEHDQMRVLFAEMKDALQNRQSDEYLGISDTLLILMQQHNMKEEQILYNIMDQRLTEENNPWKEKFKNWNKS